MPESRDSHTSCIVNDNIYIFGGQGKGEGTYFNDLYRLKISQMDSKNYVPCFHAYFTLITINQGPIPPPRTSHSCVAYKNRYLVVIGGENEETGDTPKKDDEADVDGVEKRVSVEEEKEEGAKGIDAGDKAEK